MTWDFKKVSSRQLSTLPQTIIAFQFLQTYLHAHICVVHVHTRTQVFVRAFAQKVFDKLVGVFEVVPTASPLPRFAVLQVWSLITRAPLHSSSAASFGQCMSQASRGDGVQEGCLFKSWKSTLEYEIFGERECSLQSALYIPFQVQGRKSVAGFCLY